MRSPLIAAGVALLSVLILGTGIGSAATAPGYYGSTDAGGEIAFGFKLNSKDKPKQVKHLRWANVPASCTGYPPTAHSGDLKITMKVDRHGKFRGSDEISTGAKVSFAGQFKHNYRKASGTFRLKGTIAGCANADTGKLGWNAARKP
jgi:hypothetical protein